MNHRSPILSSFESFQGPEPIFTPKTESTVDVFHHPCALHSQRHVFASVNLYISVTLCLRKPMRFVHAPTPSCLVEQPTKQGRNPANCDRSRSTHLATTAKRDGGPLWAIHKRPLWTIRKQPRRTFRERRANTCERCRIWTWPRNSPSANISFNNANMSFMKKPTSRRRMLEAQLN